MLPTPHRNETKHGSQAPRLHYLQHIDAEDLAHIGVWAKKRCFKISATRLHCGEPLPDLDTLDWLVIMGGPMNVYEETEYPWLIEEKRFVREAIDAGKTVIGICLGAQLIADALGAKVTRNAHTEIGWFPVRLTQAAKALPMFQGLPQSFTAFHWHSDRFDIPQGATPILESNACAEQAFVYGDRVLALQCHLEETPNSIEHLLENFQHEMTPGPFVQSVDAVRDGTTAIAEMHATLERILEKLPLPSRSFSR